jgi:predicted DNA-binding protein
MKRVAFHLTEQQIERLQKVSKETGLKVAELIRRAIDNFLEGIKFVL